MVNGRAVTRSELALLGLELRILFVNHIDTTLAAHQLASLVTVLKSLQRSGNLHFFTRFLGLEYHEAGLLACF